MSAPSRRPYAPALIVALALFATAGILVADAMRIEITSTYGVGPTAMPYVIAAGLAILGIAHVVMAWRDVWPMPEPDDLPPILIILGGFAALIALIGLGGGFIPATAILFAATATALTSSGVTKSRPRRTATARATSVTASAPRGLAPTCTVLRFRVARTTATM